MFSSSIPQAHRRVAGGGGLPPTVKNFRELCFPAQAQVAQNSRMIKNMHSISEFKAHSIFQGKRKLLKNPECKKYFQYSEKFQGKYKLLKNPERLKYFNTVKIFRTNLFFTASASCSKILTNKKYIVNTVKNFRKNFQCSVFSVY